MCLVWAVIGSAAAQTTTSEEALPEIVVEGASLETARRARGSAQQKPTSTGAAASPAGQGPVEGAGEGGGVAGPGSVGTTTSPSDPVITTAEIGTAVSVVTGEQLRVRQIRTAGDALRSLPGVHVNRSGGIGGITQVRIRGAEGNHTLVMIDGVKANDTTNGEYDFSDLSTEDIERIEVIRGAQSSLYGTGAIGGVINIVTRSGRGPLRVSALAEGGSFATREGALGLSGGNENVWGRIAIASRETGGFNIAPRGGEQDSAGLTTLSVKAGARLVEGVVLDVVLRHTTKDGERDTEGAVLGELQEQTDDPGVFDSSAWMQGASLTWDALDGGLTQVLRATHNETHRTDTSSTTLFTTDTLGERFEYSYTGTARFATPGLPGFRHALTGLAELSEERFTPNSRSDDPLFPFTDDGEARVREARSLAAEWRGDILGRLFLTAGVRHDDNDSFDDFTTWRTTASLVVDEIGLRPHASAGTAVKVPTMFEQFGTIPLFFTPNPNLVPEESFGWDAGIEATFWNGRMVADVTYFNADLRNQIDGFAPGPFGTFTAVNRDGTSRREGVELAVSVEVMPGLLVTGAYTYLEAFTPDGLEEVRRPRHSGRADLTYAFDAGRGTLNLGAVYNGDMEDPVRRVTGFFFGFPVLTPERFTLEEYWLVNAALTYKVGPGVELYGRVENVFDEDYQEIFGFETAGAAAYAGVRVSFDEPSSRAWAEGR